MRRFSSFAAVVLAIAVPRIASAEAWSGAKGDLTLSLGSMYQTSSQVWFGGDAFGPLPAQAWRNTLAVEFTPLEHLTFDVDLSHQFTRYTGVQTVPGATFPIAHGLHDDGKWHGEVTDADISARYQILDAPIALTPQISTKLPATDYETIGHAASGTGQKELGLGLFVGKSGLFTDNLFAEAGYVYNVVESLDIDAETSKFNLDYSRFTGTVGYQIGASFIVAGGAEFRLPHGGLSMDNTFLSQPQVVQDNHDPLLSRQYLDLNASAYYQATDSVGVGAAFAIIVLGENVSNAKIFGLNVSWTTGVL